MSMKNRISIALIELTGGRNLAAALGHLRQSGITGSIIVLCRGKAHGLKEFADVRVIENAGATIPLRRLTALKSVRSEWVALIEDTTLISPGWSRALPELLSDPFAGGFWGPVEIGRHLAARYRALGAMEYGRFSKDTGRGETLPGNCMILHRRAALDALGPDPTGVVEHVLAPRLNAAGRPVRFDPRIASTYAQNDPHGASLATRFSHGRLFAARRFAPGDRAANIRGAARAFLVPLVLAARGARHLGASTALFWIALMSLAWGAGELIGHLAGAGKSEESWS